MSIPDEAFREAFKPLYVPAHYNADDTDENKIVYALAQLGEGTAAGIAAKLADTDPSLNRERFEVIAASILNELYDKGLISGRVETGIIIYNLSKITEANDGAVDPGLLVPGLD